MNLSQLQNVFAGNEDSYREYLVLLVDVDRDPSDEIDVVISPLRSLELDTEAKQIRLYSAAARPGLNENALPIFELFIGALPAAGVLPEDPEVLVQLPIAPDESIPQQSRLGPLEGVYIGRESEEIWLLVSPLSEYPADLLPE